MRWPGNMPARDAYPWLAHIFKKGSRVSLCCGASATLDEELNAWVVWGIERYESKGVSEEMELCPHCLKRSRWPWTKPKQT